MLRQLGQWDLVGTATVAASVDGRQSKLEDGARHAYQIRCAGSIKATTPHPPPRPPPPHPPPPPPPTQKNHTHNTQNTKK